VIIAVVGATGAVGREILAILADRGVHASSVRALASARSTGTELAYAGNVLVVEALDEDSFAGVDVALFSAGAATARRFASAAVASGATVIDNSSAFRRDDEVPLVVPEVNAELIAPSGNGRATTGRIIANPHCSTIILVTALDPLRRAFGIERIVVSTYQAASGAGAAAMRELSEQTGAVLGGEEPVPAVFAEPCAFNVFSHDTPIDAATGRNVEEQKVIEETRKIFDQPGLRMSVTCIRVPVLRAHAESVNVTLSSPATETQVRDALAAAPGIALIDNRAEGFFLPC